MEIREKAEADKRAQLATEQKAKKEREERERKGAEEKARNVALRKKRFQEVSEQIKNIFNGGNKIPFYAGALILVLFLLGTIFKSVLAPSSTPAFPTEVAVDDTLTLKTASPTSTEAPTEIPDELGVGSTMISEKDGMVMVYIPAGEFQMGSDANKALEECQKHYTSYCEREWFTDEEPIHLVYLDAYWIDQTEVTNAMYAKCVEAGECDEPAFTKAYSRDGYYGDPGYDNYPVTYVSWNDAVAYSEWVDRRLLTEAEWEKAASWDEDAQAKRVYPWGNTLDDNIYAYYDSTHDTTPVGNYEKDTSYYGVFDMAGNVQEWVADWYSSDYYSNSPKDNPTGPSSGDRRVQRGIWFHSNGTIDLRSADRGSWTAYVANLDDGIRCAGDAESVPTNALATEDEPTNTPEELGVGSTKISEKDGMPMVYVPAGEFQMGSEDGDDDEKPVHTVYLDAYWIDQTEVTNAMYARCVETEDCNPPISIRSFTRESYYGSSEFDDYPVVFVSWNEAKAYCGWAGRRLPSEAEWEKAAGWDVDSEMQRLYPWGDTIDESYANYNLNIGDTIAVGSFEKGVSFYSAYDMAGNVWEWVADWYDEDYYSRSPNSNPSGSSSGENRVLRGGSWILNENSLRSANRDSYNPISTNENFGFRCARDAE